MRITLREMFLLTLIVALCLGWGLDHRRSSLEHAKIQAELKVQTSNLKLIGGLVETLGLTLDIDDSFVSINGTTTDVFKRLGLSATEPIRFSVDHETDAVWEKVEQERAARKTQQSRGS